VKHGKRVMGWHEIADGPLPAGTVVQYWGTEDPKAQVLAQQAVEQGATLVLSPANRAYLDMKYHEETPLGLQWAGLISVEQSYSWNPATLIPNVPASAIDGVEAPLWTETLDDLDKVEFMTFPRLPGIADLGWSPESALDWTTYRDRLAEQGPRWEVLGVNFYRAPEIDWL
jgi:hexosaminidase